MDMAGEAPDFAGDVGGGERESGDSKPNLAHFGRAARAGRRGRGRRCGDVGMGSAGGRVGRRCGVEEVGHRRLECRLQRLEEEDDRQVGPTYRRPKERERKGGLRGGEERWAGAGRNGPTAQEKEKGGKRKEKREKGFFPGI